MTKEQYDHEQMRRNLWCKAWTECCNSTNCAEKTIPTKYADEALKMFDYKFPEPIEPIENNESCVGVTGVPKEDKEYWKYQYECIQKENAQLKLDKSICHEEIDLLHRKNTEPQVKFYLLSDLKYGIHNKTIVDVINPIHEKMRQINENPPIFKLSDKEIIEKQDKKISELILINQRNKETIDSICSYNNELVHIINDLKKIGMDTLSGTSGTTSRYIQTVCQIEELNKKYKHLKSLNQNEIIYT